MTMKIKTEKLEAGIFDGIIFAVAQGSASFEAKRNIRKNIISNGGVASYLVTKRCQYLILLDGDSSSTSSANSIKTAQKYNIPLVSADFIDKCIEERCISLATPFIISLKSSVKKTVNDAFNNGKISISTGPEEKFRTASSAGKFLKIWDYLDPAMPPFYEFPYILAKFTVLKSETRTNFASTYASVEIHVKANSFNSDSLESLGYKYCVFVYTGNDQSDFVKVKGKLISNSNKSSKTCRLTNDSEVALENYTKILKTLKSPPRSMTVCKLVNETIPAFVGSTELQKVIENLNITQDSIGVEIKDLIGNMWKETFGCIGITSSFDSTEYSINDIDEAEKILIEIWKQDDKKCDEFQDLVKKYGNLIPNQKGVDLTINQNIYKQRKFLKLLKDIVVVSEVNPDGILGAYKALNCRLSTVKKDSLEYTSVANTIAETGPAIDLINVFAIRRPIEDENFAFSLNNKKILFHGSSIENYIGILSRGLLPACDLPEIADQENIVADLGSGIYFTDSLKKCLNYSSVSVSRKTRLLLLAEVALGNCYETNSKIPRLTCPPDGYDSVNGVVGSHFKENEFVVYNVNQQRLIYLIEFKIKEDNLSAYVKSEVEIENLWMTKKMTPEITSIVSLEQILSLKEQKLGSVKWGLLDNRGRSIPLKEVHVRGRILDLAANIVIMQAYYNSYSTTLEEFKFVFPLDDETAVCGFEAFIGAKHVIGKIREKTKAHAMYKEAIGKGHGGYLMDEQKTETFSITIGNLPPKTSVIIKISYVTELFTEGEHMVFRLPKGITGGSDVNEQSLKIAIEMPFVIKRISSPINNIQIKKTDTMATTQLVIGESLKQGFELIIQLAEIHVPRMWVENHPECDSQACMVAFYPSFDIEEDLTEKSIIIMMDSSNSMSGEVFEVAKTISQLCLHKIPSDWNFNVIIFGTVWEELFPSCQPNNMENVAEAKEFIENATSRMGCTDVYQAIRSLFFMAPSGKRFQNVFLITDGHILCSENLVKTASMNVLNTRIFTFGIGSEKFSCDKHFLKKLAYNSSGAYEEFDLQTKSKWIQKVSSQLQKASQAVITDVKVEWQQFDENIAKPLQAPVKFPPIFHGNRLVVYGFVPNCTLATLRANINGIGVSTIVSTSDLSKTTGKILHQLTARAIIRDWNQGFQDDIDSNDKLLKISKKLDIINLSCMYSVLSPMTSFVAIEIRTKGEEIETDASVLINNLLKEEDFDNLSYIDFDPVEFSGRDIKPNAPIVEGPPPSPLHFDTFGHPPPSKHFELIRKDNFASEFASELSATIGRRLRRSRNKNLSIDLGSNSFAKSSPSPMAIEESGDQLFSSPPHFLRGPPPLPPALSSHFGGLPPPKPHPPGASPHFAIPPPLPSHFEGGLPTLPAMAEIARLPEPQMRNLVYRHRRFLPQTFSLSENSKFTDTRQEEHFHACTTSSCSPTVPSYSPSSPSYSPSSPSIFFSALTTNVSNHGLPIKTTVGENPENIVFEKTQFKMHKNKNKSKKSFGMPEIITGTNMNFIESFGKDTDLFDNEEEEMEIDDMNINCDRGPERLADLAKELNAELKKSTPLLFGSTTASPKGFPKKKNFSPVAYHASCQPCSAGPQQLQQSFGGFQLINSSTFENSPAAPAFSFGFKTHANAMDSILMDSDNSAIDYYSRERFFSSLIVGKVNRSKPPMIILSENGKQLENKQIAVPKPTSTHLGSIPVLTNLKHYLINSASTILNDSIQHALKKGWGTSDVDFMKFQFALLGELTDKNLNLSKELDFWKEQQNDGAFDTSLNKKVFIEILEASGIKSLGLTLKTLTVRLCCTLENIIRTFINLGALLPTIEVDAKTIELDCNECIEQFLKALSNAPEPLIIKIVMAVAFVIKFTEMNPVLFKNLQLKNYVACNTVFGFSNASWETFILSAAKHIT